MTDKTTTVQMLKDTTHSFIKEREWSPFHTPKNISMALAAEAAELMEFFLWTETTESEKILKERKEEIEQEVADIAGYLFSLCAHYEIDLAQACEKKMKLNAEKYPVEKSKGKWTKYTEL